MVTNNNIDWRQKRCEFDDLSITVENGRGNSFSSSDRELIEYE